MTIDVDARPYVRGREAAPFEQLRVCDRELGCYALRIYRPSDAKIDECGPPKVGVVYAPGWGQGFEAANYVAETLASAGNALVATVKLPRAKHSPADMVPFRTDVLRVATGAMLECHPDMPLVVMGYSRGSFPAAVVAREMNKNIAGVSFIAPTWFQNPQTERSLVSRGVREALAAMREHKPALVRLGYHAMREVLRQPGELRRDVAAIAAQPGPDDLPAHLLEVPRIGVVAGSHDRVCPPGDIVAIARDLADSNPKTGVDVRTVSSGHLHFFTDQSSLKEVAEQIQWIAAL